MSNTEFFGANLQMQVIQAAAPWFIRQDMNLPDRELIETKTVMASSSFIEYYY